MSGSLFIINYLELSRAEFAFKDHSCELQALLLSGFSPDVGSGSLVIFTFHGASQLSSSLENIGSSWKAGISSHDFDSFIFSDVSKKNS